MLEKETKDNRSEKQRRVLGCAAWGIIVAVFASILLIFPFDFVFSRVRNGYFVVNFSFVSFIFYSFFFFMIPTLVVAIIIGSQTKSPSNFYHAVLITPVVTIFFTYFCKLLYESNNNPPKGLGESFWNPPSIGISAILGGIILGLIASIGFWHAGRS